MAGRVFKNKPAPDNLEVPPHMYLSDTLLLIGEDEQGLSGTQHQQRSTWLNSKKLPRTRRWRSSC